MWFTAFELHGSVRLGGILVCASSGLPERRQLSVLQPYQVCTGGFTLKKLLVLLAVLTFSALAFAGSDTINFEQYSAYTTISNQYLASDGVSFSSALQLVAPYYDSIDYPPHSGSGVITNDPNDPITAAFIGVAGSQLAGNYVYSVSFWYSSPTGVTMTAYNAAGQVIGTATGGAEIGADGQITFTSPGCTSWTAACAIAYITIASGNGPDSETVDDLSYQDAATPEPGTLVLMGSGILGLAGTLRRKLSMLNLKKATLVVLGVLTLVCTFSLASLAATPRLITESIDENNRVMLEGNVRFEANAKNDAGRMPDNFALNHLMLVLKHSPEQEQALQQFMAGQQNPHSRNYHNWLTAKEFGDRYGVGNEDLNTVREWLASHGFKVNLTYPNRMVIDFTGNVGQVRETFQTEIHSLNVDGAKRWANMTNPKIPAALSGVVEGVATLNNFPPEHHSMARSKVNYTSGNADFPYPLVPGDVSTIYNMTPLFNAGISGQGQTIVLVEDTNIYNPPTPGQPCSGDWGVFRCTFGLSRFPQATFAQIQPQPPSGPSNCTSPGTNGDDGEAAIDIEYASTSAPNAAIVLASCQAVSGVSFGGLLAIINLFNESSAPPAILSMSYGECEEQSGATLNALFNSTFQQGAAEGVSSFVSSGDANAAGCDRNRNDATHGINITGWGSSPYVVSVGGTDFLSGLDGTENQYWNNYNNVYYASAKSYIPEMPWNGTCAFALLAQFEGFATPYGSNGFCNSGTLGPTLLSVFGGSGGPSGCATGAPQTASTQSGTCLGWPKPAYQSVFGNPSDGVRDIPDVSLFASNGLFGTYYVTCWSDPSQTSGGSAPCTGPPSDWAGFGGTSVSTPIMAGIQALVNQSTGQRWGNPDTVYYQLANIEYGASGNSSCNSHLGNAVGTSCIFYDVTDGDMNSPCTGDNCYLPSGTNGVLSTAFQPLTSITSAKGSNYATAPVCTLTSGGGTGGGTCTANITNPSPVQAATLTTAGSGYGSTPTCAITSGGGTGAACTIKADPIGTLTLLTGGSGYTSTPTCAIAGGGGTGATCTARRSTATQMVTSVTLSSAGSGYTGSPTCTITGGGGTGATCSAIPSTAATGLTLTAAGSGYTSNPTCTISGGGGSGATCSATADPVVSVTINTPGAYAWLPNCTLSGGGGTGATCLPVTAASAPSNAPAYNTTTGWDFASGIGTVNAFNLVNQWSSAPSAAFNTKKSQ
jgi:hypothetical protein